MTKVIISPSLLEYRQAMARTVEQVRRENTIAGLRPCTFDEPARVRQDVISSEPCMAGLLKPATIEMLFPSIFMREGQLDGLIQVRTSDDFGVMNVYVIIGDAEGNVIESDYAMRNEDFMNHWWYVIEIESGPHRSLTIQAVAMDCLGGMGLQRETITVE